MTWANPVNKDTMLDRKTQPAFHPLNKVSIPDINTDYLANGTSVSFLHHDNTSVFKLELVIKAGSWYAPDYHLVPLTLKMLIEGTGQKTGKDIAESFDKLGSFIELVPGFDNSTLVVYGLSKYFQPNLELLSEVLFQPAFDKFTFDALKKREAHKLELNLEKSSYKASTRHRANLFGTEHPYGITASSDGINDTALKTVQEYYKNNFHQFDVLISGNLPVDFKSLLNQYFGSHNSVNTPQNRIHSTITGGIHKIEERNPKFIQSSIRMGRVLFNRNGSDYIDFMVLNEVFGGYFGSRLMKNIREDKGFTYGIYSQLYALNHSGYFTIATDVNSDNEAETINEILYELNKLKTELIPESELTTVKNYMTGTFAGSLGTPFSVMDKYKAVHYQGLSLSFFDSYIEKVNAVTPERLQSLANQYLNEEDLSSATVGR